MGKQVLRNENLFFILSDILFAEQVSIERNNPVIVIFRHLLQLLPNLYFLYVMFDLLFLYVMFGLVPDIALMDSPVKPIHSLCHYPDLIRHSSVEQGIHRHKAWPHDMHAESIARQQRFVPQPIMRSSRQQLVIFARGLLKNRQKINCGHPC